jgi:hypothetical protein
LIQLTSLSFSLSLIPSNLNIHIYIYILPQAQASIILCWKIVLSIYDILQIAIKLKCMIQRSLLSSYL